MKARDVRAAFAVEIAPWSWGDPLDVRYAVLDQVKALSGRVLDAGCGPGILLGAMSGIACAYGIDLSTEALLAARRFAPRAALVRGDLGALPFAEASFDAVIALHVIEAVSDREGVVSELARVLRPAGLLLLTTPNADHPRYRRHSNKLMIDEVRSLLSPHFDLRIRGYNPLPTQRLIQRAPALMAPLLRVLLALPLPPRWGASIFVEGRRRDRRER